MFSGFAFKDAATEPFAEQAVITNGINYYGTKKFSEIIFPLLRSHARQAYFIYFSVELFYIPVSGWSTCAVRGDCSKDTVRSCRRSYFPKI